MAKSWFFRRKRSDLYLFHSENEIKYFEAFLLRHGISRLLFSHRFDEETMLLCSMKWQHHGPLCAEITRIFYRIDTFDDISDMRMSSEWNCVKDFFQCLISRAWNFFISYLSFPSTPSFKLEKVKPFRN